MALAELVQSRLEQLSISQAEAARRCRISGTLMHNILVGNHLVPRPETMEKVSTGLQLPLVSLYHAAGVQLPSASPSSGSPFLRLAEGIVLDPSDEELLAAVEKVPPLWEALSESLRDNLRALLRVAIVQV